MPRHEDDDIDVVKGLSASRDDAARGPDRRPPPQRSAVQAKSASETKPASAARTSGDSGSHSVNHTAQKNGAGFKWLVALVLLVLVAVCGWLGQQVVQLQQHLSDNKNALQLERSRMESISAQVHETGTSFVETGNVLESKFAFFESEIRKLWDVSNKRNKKDITTNAAQLKTLTANFKNSQQGFQGELKTLTKEQAETSQAVGKFNKQLASENTALRASLEEQSEELLLMNGELEILRQRFNSMPNDLSKRVAVNEEAVQVIDAGRKQLLNRISQLQKRVDGLMLEKAATP